MAKCSGGPLGRESALYFYRIWLKKSGAMTLYSPAHLWLLRQR